MQKKGAFFLFESLFLIIFLSTITYAQNETQNETSIISEIEQEYPDAELESDAGTTPGDFFYFLDTFFDRFGDELRVKEEKIAEIRVLIQRGEYGEALEALERYRLLADKLEAEIDPEKRDEARRSAAAIRNAISELESEIPEEFREEFVDGVLEKEAAIVISVEISSRIKELCETLSELDPLEYSRVCRTDDDSPDWHKRLDKDLTEEQREEAKKFAEIMSECFRTSGQQCRCEEIPFTEFAEMCSVAAPLAVQCEIEGNEAACEELNNLEMPELPAHLQGVFDRLEGDISEAQFELHMPRECREAGVTSPRECMRIMVQTHAPPECRDAILNANVQNEREAREICERIMFELNAPEECVERGITNPRECAVLMFQLSAPQECIDAGLTGEHRSDHEKCRVLVESKGVGPGGFGSPALGIRCREIQDPEERLDCYDNALSGVQQSSSFSSSTQGRPSSSSGTQWPEPCVEANALTEESCAEVMRSFTESQQISPENTTSSPGFTQPQCGEGEALVCENNECRCVGSEPSTTEPNATTGTGSVIFSNEFSRYYYR